MNFWLSLGGGLLCGTLSGMGVGGGTLLLILLTHVLQVPQLQAQYINILYFIPASLLAGLLHAKHGLVDKHTVLWCAAGGLAGAVGGSFLASMVQPDQLRLGFSWLLLAVGVWQLFQKAPSHS